MQSEDFSNVLFVEPRMGIPSSQQMWRLGSAPLAPHVSQVFVLRTNEQVQGIDAAWVVAAMQNLLVQLKPNAVKQFVSDTMGLADAVSARTSTDQAIAVLVLGAGPLPALVLGSTNMACETQRKRRVGSRTNLTPPRPASAGRSACPA